MTPFLKTLLVAAVATSVLLPAAAIAKQSDEKTTAAKSKSAGNKPAGKQRWRGYGFLPGYRQPPALTDWRAQNRRYRAQSMQYEQRFLYYRPWSGYAQLRYGWGRPGVYRGQWNGGSFGPCWTQTPIGMVWNCGN